MHLTMTIADVVVALLIGVVGSLVAAYAFVRIPRLSTKVVAWYSEQSKAAAELRVASLQKELDRVQLLQNNIGAYVGWMLRQTGIAVMVFTLAVWVLIFSSSDLYRLMTTTGGNSPNFDMDKINIEELTSYQTKLLYFGMIEFGASFVMLIIGTTRIIYIIRNSNLEGRVNSVRDQITSLRNKWPAD